MYFMIDNDMKQNFQDNGKQCNAIEYSNGGHILAGADQYNIKLFNAYSFEVISIIQPP